MVGPFFKTENGYAGMQGTLYKSLTATGYNIITVSAFRNKYLRMIDTVWTVFFLRKRTKLILLQSFGLLAFIMEDFISLVANLYDIPICFTLHGGAFHDFYLKHPSWVKRVLSRADEINTPSYFLKEKLEKEKLDFKIKYIPNYIDLELFPFKRDVTNTHSILWVRAFHEIYNPDLAIEAVRVLKERYPNIKLTMVGLDLGELKRCQELILKFSLSKNVDITGRIENHRLYKYYQQNKVFINTTRFESFGVSLIEAGACGIPMVSVNVGEIPYLWKHEVNILLAKRSPEDFAIKIIELFENQSLYESISLEARKNAMKFTWEYSKDLWVETITINSKK